MDWYPWGDEAFQVAEQNDKPIFLSIGYATCHWCHVMERESFENAETAKVLNDHFVPVKVDREERPDVDSIYMKALHATGQQGGWPLNMFLTPDRRPITGGTYFPPEAAYGRPSFRQVLETIHKVWTEDRSKLLQTAESLTTFLDEGQVKADGGIPGLEAVAAAADGYRASFDKFRGGFVGNGPNKFPPSMGLVLLLTQYRRTGEADLLHMVETTLEHMKRGGIYDQIGGGLSRYSTDHDWLVPHFEKMLYDNALFASALTECYRITGKEHYRTWTLDIYDYLKRDMTSPEGAFYSAEDADSEGVEGKFYVWTGAEFETILTEAGMSVDEIKQLSRFWGVTSRGNFEGKNILHEPVSRADFLAAYPGDEKDFNDLLGRARAVLHKARDGRVRPLRDDKILTSWNALMISALAQSARAFAMPPIAADAVKAAEFIYDKMRDDNGRLLRRYRQGDARFAGTLVDYAQTGCAFADLYRTTFDPRWLTRAAEMADLILELFPGQSGAFHDTVIDAKDLIVRTTESYDGVEPSGNSSAARLFLTLAGYGLETAKYRKAAAGILGRFHEALSKYGSAHAAMLQTLVMHHTPPLEIAVVTNNRDASDELVNALNRELPLESFVALAREDEIEAIGAKVPLMAHRKAIHSPNTIYVCRELACKRPVGTLDETRALIAPQGG